MYIYLNIHHIYLYFPFMAVLTEGTLWHLQRFLWCYLIYHTRIHLIHHCPLSCPPLIPGICSTGIIFAFTYMRTHFLHNIHPPTPFFTTIRLPVVPSALPGRTCSTLSFCWFCGRIKKKWHFYSIEIKVAEREFPWDMSMYICLITPTG
jgi:hypothetical protein